MIVSPMISNVYNNGVANLIGLTWTHYTLPIFSLLANVALWWNKYNLQGEDIFPLFPPALFAFAQHAPASGQGSCVFL